MKHVHTSRHGQRGTVLIISLIILVVMLISAAALVRSFDITLGTAGNLAFKRDLAQRSEEASQSILAQFRPGGRLALSTVRLDPASIAIHRSLNYSPIVLASNTQGIPMALVNDQVFATLLFNPDNDIRHDGQSIRLRYVVDRLCSSIDPDSEDICTLADATLVPGGSSSDWVRAERRSAVATGGAGAGLGGAVRQPVVYRLSVRADGPRGTQSFFQTTFSCCDS